MEMHSIERTLEHNEEQLRMLFMVLEDGGQGICLFQSEEQSKWVERIRMEQKNRKLLIHNIADDDETAGIPTFSDFRRWLSHTDADTVILYNLQLLGIRFGDDKAVEKLNSMRDQIQTLGKLFLLGTSPYFGLLLSRNARDFYSCIRYHFRFSDHLTEIWNRETEHHRIPGGDDTLTVEKYWAYKNRCQDSEDTGKVQLCLECMKSWLEIREYLPLQEKESIREMALFSDQYYKQRKLKASDGEWIWILAGTWLELNEKEKALQWYQSIADTIRKELGESHKLYADALVNFSDYYETICDFERCEKNYDSAICIYKKEKVSLDGYYKAALNRRAVLYKRNHRFQDALAIYTHLLQHDTEKYGSCYDGNALYLNNMGRVYEELSDHSKALSKYHEALDIVTGSHKRNNLLVVLYNNISSVYLKNEDTANAWKYIRLAKKETVLLYGGEAPCLIGIYNIMSGIWCKKGQTERELEYLEKALNLIHKTHFEETEEAAFVYHNTGNAFLHKKDPVNAISFFQRALKVRLKIYGKANKYTAGTYEGLAAAFYLLSDRKSYDVNLRRADEIYSLLSENQ